MVAALRRMLHRTVPSPSALMAVSPGRRRSSRPGGLRRCSPRTTGRAGVVGRRREQDLADGVGVERVATLVPLPVLLDDQRGDAGDVRRRHRGALQVGVEAAVRPPLVAATAPRSRRSDCRRVGQPLRDGDVQRVGRQDHVARRLEGRRAEAVAEPAAGGGDLDVAEPVVRVVGLGAGGSDRRHRDHVRALAGQVEAVVGDGAPAGGAGG